MAVVNSKLGRFGLFLANPMVAKLDKIEETGEPSCKVNSIVRKTLFFLMLTILGVVIFFLTSDAFPNNSIEVEEYTVNLYEAVIAFGSLLFGILGTVVAFKFVRSSFIFGSIYSLGQGYAVALLCSIFGSEYIYPCLAALGITILLVVVMLILYRLHLVKIEKKFVSVLITLIVVGIILTIGVFVMNTIPETKEYAKFIMDNSILISCLGAVGIVVATLFLLVDFEVINHSVNSKLPKKYEWLGAFALSFSIIELYLKILNFILQFAGNKNNQEA